MSLVKPFQEGIMTVHQSSCVFQKKFLQIVRPGSSPRVPGYAHFNSTTSRRAGPPNFERFAIPDAATPAPKSLAATVLTADPARVEQVEVIKRLPRLLFPFHNPLRSLTFFVTPEYVKWLDEDNGFLQNALDHIFQDWSATQQNLSNGSLAEGYQQTIESRVAVVDRIPFPGGGSSGSPGISFMASAWSRHYLKDGVSTRSADGKTNSETPLISVKFPCRNEYGEVNITRMYLRPANTLFANGLPYTMFADKWVGSSEAESGPKFLRKSTRENIGHITFNHTFENSSLRLPMQKLTEAKEISTCMGNVISKLAQKQDSEDISASHELEESVSTFLKTKDATNGTLAVFALIIPKPQTEIDSIRAPCISTALLGYDKTRTVEDGGAGKQEAMDSIRLAISQGAHLHRVTSGGGGWGKKQGLLSLEPALGFEVKRSNDTTSWTPSWAESALPGIAHPGDMIEFYGIFSSKEAEQKLTREESVLTASKVRDTKGWKSRAWAEGDTSNIVLGVTPQDSSALSTVSTLGEELISIPHHFGMLSEQGMALSTIDFEIDKEATTTHTVHREHETERTRIDVPHTVLTYSVQNRFATPPDAKKMVKVRWRRVQANLFDENAPTYHYSYSDPASEAHQNGADASSQSKPSYQKDLERLTAMQLASEDHQTNTAFSPTIDMSASSTSARASQSRSEQGERLRVDRAVNRDAPRKKPLAPGRRRKENAGR